MVVLTDLHPHLDAWTAAAKKSDHLTFAVGSVDAANAPGGLLGDEPDEKVFRLFNLAFHHFDDELGGRILRNSVETAGGFGFVFPFPPPSSRPALKSSTPTCFPLSSKKSKRSHSHTLSCYKATADKVTTKQNLRTPIPDPLLPPHNLLPRPALLPHHPLLLLAFPRPFILHLHHPHRPLRARLRRLCVEYAHQERGRGFDTVGEKWGVGEGVEGEEWEGNAHVADGVYELDYCGQGWVKGIERLGMDIQKGPVGDRVYGRLGQYVHMHETCG